MTRDLTGLRHVYSFSLFALFTVRNGFQVDSVRNHFNLFLVKESLFEDLFHFATLKLLNLSSSSKVHQPILTPEKILL